MDLALNAQRFSGKQYIHIYDNYRPTPPEAILQHALNYLGTPRAKLVLDIGCGTGLSTLAWDGLADEIIIVLDIEAKPTILYLVLGKDVALDYTLRVINKVKKLRAAK